MGFENMVLKNYIGLDAMDEKVSYFKGWQEESKRAYSV